MGTKITFKRPDGKDASGYLAAATRPNRPGLVVIQEWWGLQDQIKGMCERFADAGYQALAPDLYAGTVVPYHDTAVGPAAGAVVDAGDLNSRAAHAVGDDVGRFWYHQLARAGDAAGRAELRIF